MTNSTDNEMAAALAEAKATLAATVKTGYYEAPPPKPDAPALETNATAQAERVVRAAQLIRDVEAGEANTSLAIRPYLMQLADLYRNQPIPLPEVEMILADLMAGKVYKNDATRDSAWSQERTFVRNAHILHKGCDLYATLALETGVSKVAGCPVKMARTIARKFEDMASDPARTIAKCIGLIVAEKLQQVQTNAAKTDLDKLGDKMRTILNNTKIDKAIRADLLEVCRKHRIPTEVLKG